MSLPTSLPTQESALHDLRETAEMAVDTLQRAVISANEGNSYLDRAAEALTLNAETIKALERKGRRLVGCVNRMALTALAASICLIAAGVLLLPVNQPAAIFFIVAGSLMIAAGALDYFSHRRDRCGWEGEEGSALPPAPIETTQTTETVQP